VLLLCLSLTFVWPGYSRSGSIGNPLNPGPESILLRSHQCCLVIPYIERLPVYREQHRCWTFSHWPLPFPTPKAGMVIRIDSALVENAILYEYLTFDVMLEEADIGPTDPMILMV
jgi:hypothetical protein